MYYAEASNHPCPNCGSHNTDPTTVKAKKVKTLGGKLSDKGKSVASDFLQKVAVGLMPAIVSAAAALIVQVLPIPVESVKTFLGRLFIAAVLVFLVLDIIKIIREVMDENRTYTLDGVVCKDCSTVSVLEDPGELFRWSFSIDEAVPDDPHAFQHSDEYLYRERNRFTAAALAFLLGSIGAHKFYLRYRAQGAICLSVSIACMAAFFAMISPESGLSSLAVYTICPVLALEVIAVIEGINYVRVGKDEFVRRYLRNRRPWF